MNTVSQYSVPVIASAFQPAIGNKHSPGSRRAALRQAGQRIVARTRAAWAARPTSWC